MEEFSSLDQAFVTLLLSVSDGLPIAKLIVVAPTMSFLWCTAWYLLSSLLILNALLAIIIDSFHAVKEIVVKEERLEIEALAQNIKTPSLLLAKLQEVAPMALLRKNTKEQNKAAKEEQENISELVESLSEVDLSVLYKRLGEAAMENQSTVTAIELKDCFGGSQRKARLFINRVCTLANLRPAHAVNPLTTLEASTELQSVVDRFEMEVHGCQQDFEEQSRMFRVMLPQGNTMRGKGGFLGKRQSPPSTSNPAPAKSIVGKDVGAATMSGTGLLKVKAPARGELGVAATALEVKRSHRRSIPEQQALADIGTGPPPASGQGVLGWNPDEEVMHGRYAVASYITADPLKRR